MYSTTANRHSVNTLLKYGVVVTVIVLFMYVAFRPRYTQIEHIKFPNFAVYDSEAALNQKFNLVDETSKWKPMYYSTECTLDYINENKLPQDHPCVIEVLRRDFLIPPPPHYVPLELDSDSLDDRSPGQTNVILRLLKNQTNGFYIDCGAHDGEYMSNTIDLERKFGWTGVLIEANPVLFEKMRKKNRKSWLAPVCLSLHPYPTKAKFQPKGSDSGQSHIEGAEKTLQKPGKPGVDPDMIEAQCFPLYSILLAIGTKRVDFFSLDVEGHEISVLKTVPFHKVFMKSLTVEWDNIPEGEPDLTDFMENSGFVKVDKVAFHWSNDVIFINSKLISPHKTV